MSNTSFADSIPMHYRERFFRDPFFQDCWKILDKPGNVTSSSSEKRTEVSSSSTSHESSTSTSANRRQEASSSSYFEEGASEHIKKSSSTAEHLDQQQRSDLPKKSAFNFEDTSKAFFEKPMEFPKMNLDSPQSPTNGMSRVVNDPDKFQVMVEVDKFAPDELTVKTVDNYIVVEGKHEEKKDPTGYITRQFTRKYLLPIDCRPENVRCNLSADGILVVSVPKENIDLLPLKETIIEIAKTDQNVRDEQQQQHQQQQRQGATSAYKPTTAA